VASVVFKPQFASEEFDKHWRGGDPTPPERCWGPTRRSPTSSFSATGRFESESPELELTQSFTLGNYLRYLLSGG
jgi:hypothetical protein